MTFLPDQAQIDTKIKPILLLIQVFVVSSCSLSYELLLGTAAANITGNSVLAFSLSIGLYLAGLGTGAFCTKWISNKQMAEFFVWTETGLALAGGLSLVLLYLSLVFTPYFQLVQILLTFLIGLISGLEIPILTRILEVAAHKSPQTVASPHNSNQNFELKGILANVLSFDYLGGLLASVLFPLILLPYFGLVRLSFLVGLLNLSMALLGLYLFWDQIKNKYLPLGAIGLIGCVLVAAAFWATPIYNFIENGLYRDPIVYSAQSQYQRIVLTQKAGDTRLYLNGGIQFSSQDEYRYHESLIIPAMLLLTQKTNNLNIVIFGGGDGLGVAQILKFEPFVNSINLIDIDPVVTNLAKNSEILKNLNQNSLSSNKVKIYNQDAWTWIQKQPPGSIDLIISDLPDPDDTSIAKLYTREFFKFAALSLKESGLLVTQSSSPYSTPKVFWSENKTLNTVFRQVLPYQAYVPSFGQWGFHLASKTALATENILAKIAAFEAGISQTEILASNRFVDLATLNQMFVLSPDLKNPRLRNGEIIKKDDLKINTLDNLILVKYYTESGPEKLE